MTLDLFELETTPDGGGDGGAAAAEPAAAPEPDLTAGEELAREEEPRSYSQAEFDQAVREAAYAAAEEAHAVAQAQLARFQAGVNTPVPGATPGPSSGQMPEFDLLDPESVAARDQWLLEQVGQLIDQRIGPVAQTFEQQQEAARVAHGEEVLNDMLADAIAAGGDITDEAKELAIPLATMMFPQHAERYGPDSARSAEAAVYQAVDLIRKVEAAAEARGAARQANATATLAGASSEPAAAAGVAIHGDTEPVLDPMAIARKYAANVR